MEVKKDIIEDVIVISDEHLALLREFISQKDIVNINNFCHTHNLISLASQIGYFSDEDIVYLLKAADVDVTSEIITYLEIQYIELLIDNLTKSEIKSIFEEISKDDIVDILSELSRSSALKIKTNLSKETRDAISALLSHDEDTAGHQMNPDFIKVYETDSVKTIINKIRKNDDIIEHSSILYIISKTGLLVGWINIKDLLLLDATSKITNVIHRDIISVRTSENIEEASQVLRKYDLSRLPVVDEENNLVGSLTSDDVIHILVEEATEDIHKLSAISELSKPYLKSSVFALTKSRIVWLIFLSLMLTVPELLIHKFTDGRENLAQALTPVLPLVMATAGNAGGQASATVIRALSVGEIKSSDYLKVIFKELRVAIVIASVISLITFGRFTLLGRNVEYSLIVSAALFTIILVSKMLGGILPLVAKLVKADPATMAGPIVATIVDILSIVILFNLFIIIMPDYIG